MHCVKILKVVFVSRAFFSSITDRQDHLKRLNYKYEMQRFCVSVSYFLNEWTVSSVLYVYYILIALFAYFGSWHA